MKAWAKYHPVTLMVYFLSVLLVSMFLWNPILLLSSLLGSACFCAVLQSRKETALDLAFYLPLFLMVTITNPLFSHNGVTPLFFLNGNPVTLEAFFYGAAIAVMVISVMLWCKCYSKIMTSDKFLFLFGRAVPKLSLILSMALRFIPLFRRQSRKVSRAQKAMGLYSSKSYVDRVRAGMRVLMALIGWSLENSMETAASMQARGYGLRGRTQFSLFRFSASDGVMLTLSVLLTGVTLFGSGAIEFFFYPRVSALQSSIGACIVYAAFGLLCFLPLILEGKESIQWRYYKSKM